jgi:hypothetical protein
VTIPPIPSSTNVSKSNPTTPIEHSPPSNSHVLMRTRSPNKLTSVVVVPRQTSEHCKQTAHVTTRPNSMI